MAEHDGEREYTFELLSKQGQVITVLAGQLLASKPGDALLRVQDNATELEASVGTIHSSLNYLQDIGAAQLEGRGRLGTFAQTLDYSLLWSLAMRRPLIGAMPLPYTRHLEGLATGIRAQFNQQPLNLDLRFMRGSTNRLQRLSSQEIDYAIVSRFAADTAHVQGFDLDVLLLLGPGTYTAKHVLLLNQPTADGIEDGMRVGIDTKSADHARVVHAVCRGQRVKFINIDYNQGLKLLNSDVIDATVWTEEDLPAEFANLKIIPLDTGENPTLVQLSEAALVVERGNTAVSHVLQDILKSDALRKIQKDVIDFVQLPAY